MSKEYHIVGIGTLGFPLAIAIAKTRGGVIHLWDDDIVKEHNIIFPQKYIGRSKVFVAQQNIGSLARVIVHNQKVTNEDLNQCPNRFVIDCSDTKSQYKLITDIKISFDGPILTISDGRISTFKMDNKFYYPTTIKDIKKAIAIIMSNLKSSWSYVNFKRKVYRIAQTREEENEIIYSSKREASTHIAYLHTKEAILIPQQKIEKEMTRLTRVKTVDRIITTLTYWDHHKRESCIVNMIGDLVSYMEQYVDLVPAQEYYVRLKKSTIENSIGILNLEIYHLPASC